MKCRRWALFATACLTAIVAGGDTAELPAKDVAASFTEPISSRDTVRESPLEDEASRDVVGEAVRDVSGEASHEIASAAESASRCDESNTTPRGCKTSVDQLHERVMRLTDQLSKAAAALDIAEQREEKLALLEREKYCYVKSASDNVMKLVDNVKQAERLLATDTAREQKYQMKLARVHRMQNRSGRRLQVIRRLLVGAEVGMVHMEVDKELNACELKKQS